MSETLGRYNKDDGTPFKKSVPSAERTTLDFVTAINSFHWRCDYFKFCETLGLTPDDYAEQKYSQLGTQFNDADYRQEQEKENPFPNDCNEVSSLYITAGLCINATSPAQKACVLSQDALQEE